MAVDLEFTIIFLDKKSFEGYHSTHVWLYIFTIIFTACQLLSNLEKFEPEDLRTY